MKKILIFTLFAIMLTSCADVTPIEECAKDEPYGFFFGIWHGMIVPFSFIGSLFDSDIAMYAVNNSGGWYDFGFLIGIGAFTTTTITKK